MASERIQRRVDRLLDQIEQEADKRNWQLVRELSEEVLGFAPDNGDARAFLSVAEQRLSSIAVDNDNALPASTIEAKFTGPVAPPAHPTSLANGRYQVKRYLGEGGKKKVYLAHDTMLDRDVGLDRSILPQRATVDQVVSTRWT